MAKRKKHKQKKEPDKAAPPPGRWMRYWPALVVAIVPFLLYSDSLKAGYVWDDHNLIENRFEHHSIADFGRLWVSDFWQTDRVTNHSQYYRPLTTTTFMLDSVIHGNDPRGYHLTNIILYSICCVLAFLVYQNLFQSNILALLLALAFAAQPIHTENVAWLSGRTDIVCAAMMFGAMIAYLAADEMERPWLMAISVALFLLSLFGKEMSITMVAVVFIHQWLWHKSLKRCVLRALPFLIAAAGFWIIHSIAAPHLADENIYTTPLTYVLNVARNLALGVWHSFVPGGYHYLVTATREEAALIFQLPRGIHMVSMLGLLVAVAAGAGIAAWKKQRVIALGLASGLLCLVPISGIIPIGVIFAVRLLFIPGFFFLMALGALLEKASARSLSAGGFTISPATVIMAPIIMVYAVMTVARVPAWRNDVTLMEAVIEKEPDAALAHFIMGNGLALQGRNDESASHFERAVALRPEYSEAQFNLGIMEQRRGKIREAEKRYRAALKTKPDYMPARMALVRILRDSGRGREALALMPKEK